MASAQQGDPYKSAQEILDSLTPAVRTRGIRVEASRQERLAVDLDIRFEFGSNRLTQEAKKQLAALGEALNSPQLQSRAFEIIGHTDSVGSAAYNLELSGKRAAAVRTYLVENHQVAAGRLTALGMGEAELLPGVPPEHPNNRRVEIRAH